MSENNLKPIEQLASRKRPVVIVILLLMTSAVVHGSIDGRWSSTKNLVVEGAKIATLPETCGDWKLSSKVEIEENALEILRCHGWDQRQYRNEKTGQTILVAVMFGPRGPMAVHTPEVCGAGVGMDQTRERRVETVSTTLNRHQLWSIEFSDDEKPNGSIESWYGWSDGGAFQASKHPRIWLTDNLYKIQLSGPAGSGADQPIRDFLADFVPQVESILQ